MENVRDIELIAQCVSGRQEALEAFVCQYSDLIYRSIQHTLKIKHVAYTVQDVEDLHHSAFLQLLDHNCRKLGQYEGKNGCRLSSWLRVVIARMVLNQIRKKGHGALTWRRKQVSLDHMAELKSDDADAVSVIEKLERMQVIGRSIRRLSLRDQQFVHLCFDQELPSAEIARIMALTTQNVYTIKHRVIQRLKTDIESIAGG